MEFSSLDHPHLFQDTLNPLWVELLLDHWSAPFLYNIPLTSPNSLSPFERVRGWWQDVPHIWVKYVPQAKADYNQRVYIKYFAWRRRPRFVFVTKIEHCIITIYSCLKSCKVTCLHVIPGAAIWSRKLVGTQRSAFAVLGERSGQLV